MRCNMFQFLGRCVIPIPARTEEHVWLGATILYVIAVTICLEICVKTVSKSAARFTVVVSIQRST